ncbi:MAG: hypothetical protein M5F18_07705 [Asgard group archaeon]|nr:hypothetical protein [Asgard group archaeon]
MVVILSRSCGENDISGTGEMTSVTEVVEVVGISDSKILGDRVFVNLADDPFLILSAV